MNLDEVFIYEYKNKKFILNINSYIISYDSSIM